MTPPLTLVSHSLCPYVQRIAIALAEKQVVHCRRTVDLSNKPDWFLAISPLGRTPVLKVGEESLFESAAILEYLEDTQPHPLHPKNPITRARHRAWMGFSSEILADIAGFYSASDATVLEIKAASLRVRFGLMEKQLAGGPWFDGDRFSLVDACFGPVFRYFETFEAIAEFCFFDKLPRVQAWRSLLLLRKSVQDAVAPDYSSRLESFLRQRGSELSRRMMHVAA